MTFALLLAGLACLTVPGIASRSAQRRPAAGWARLVAAAMLVGMVAVETALVLLAAPVVMDGFGVHGAAHFCASLLGSVGSDLPILCWLAAVLALVLGWRGGRALLVARRARLRVRAEPWVGEHHSLGDADLVVVPSDRLLAVGVPGSRSQVVVSRGLVDVLDAEQLGAVLRHELAHLRLGHRRLLLVAAVAEQALGMLAPVRRSAQALRTAIERWADAEAELDPPGPRATWVARAVTAGPVGALLPAAAVLGALAANDPHHALRVAGIC